AGAVGEHADGVCAGEAVTREPRNHEAHEDHKDPLWPLWPLWLISLSVALRYRSCASVPLSIAQLTVRARPIISSVASSVGANGAKSKMKLPPPASSDCVGGFTVCSPRLMTSPVAGFLAPGFGVSFTVMRVRCASA